MKKIINLLFASLLLVSASFAMAEVVDINTASAETLAAAMVGVGEKRAEAIVAHREAHGPFSSVDELVQVSGIGSRLLEENRDKLRVGTR